MKDEIVKKDKEIEPKTQISVRFAPDLLKNIDLLVKRLRSMPRYRGLRMTRASVLNMLVHHGIGELNRQLSKAKDS